MHEAATSNLIEVEFLGDYNSAWATNSGVFGAWNDARDTSLCPAVDTYRQSLLDGSPTAPPAPQNDCPDTFGASSIYGGWYTPWYWAIRLVAAGWWVACLRVRCGDVECCSA